MQQECGYGEVTHIDMDPEPARSSTDCECGKLFADMESKLGDHDRTEYPAIEESGIPQGGIVGINDPEQNGGRQRRNRNILHELAQGSSRYSQSDSVCGSRRSTRSIALWGHACKQAGPLLRPAHKSHFEAVRTCAPSLSTSN